MRIKVSGTWNPNACLSTDVLASKCRAPFSSGEVTGT